MSENSETKWTGGDWKAHPPSSVVGALISYGDISKGENIAFVVAQRDKAETEANAQLIAAAPELYNALEQFTVAMRDKEKPDMLLLVNALHKADAALRSARGTR